jgi:hypothetical protein
MFGNGVVDRRQMNLTGRWNNGGGLMMALVTMCAFRLRTKKQIGLQK